MKSFLFIIVLTSFIGCNSKNQKVREELLTKVEISSYTFEEFAPMLQTNSDTLYVVNFWATWCEPCIEELPAFEAINEKYKNQKFKMLLVSLDFSKQKEKKLTPFVTKNQLKAQVIHLNDPDANAWIEKVDANWSGSIPATLVFTKDKRVFFEQSFTKEQLQNTIDNF
ncbi:MAG: redoxin domain-containing protein [Flavobacteriales bacterium]|nr:redoxin domain-containing protein [Flavobacteriales bacterium]